MAVAVAAAVSGGVAVPVAVAVAVPVAGLTKRFFNQKDFFSCPPHNEKMRLQTLNT